MTNEEREALGKRLIDLSNEMGKYSAENEHYGDLAKNLTAVAGAINEADNKEKEIEQKEKELELEETRFKSERKRGIIGTIVSGLLTVAGIVAPILVYQGIGTKYDNVSKTDIPSKELTRATDKARDNALNFPKVKL